MCHNKLSTHVDKVHIHNHIEFNSTNLDCSGKFNNFKNSAMALRKLNDRICREHGYSVIEEPKGKGQSYKEKAAAKRGRSFKEKLRINIDEVIPASKDFEDFLSNMRDRGYEIKRRGKSLEFRAERQTRFTRSFRLGNEYTEEAIRSRINGKHNKKDRSSVQANRKNVNLLIDIQAKMRAGKGKGYEKWAKIFNLKEAARTLNFLTERNITDYTMLEDITENMEKEFESILGNIKRLEGRMTDIAKLKMHIINYSKTRDVYAAYRRSRDKKTFRSEHKADIEKHEAAKAAFDALEGKPIPKVAQLSKEYNILLTEKRKLYEKYKLAKKDMLDYKNAKQNVDRILGLSFVDERKKRLEAER